MRWIVLLLCLICSPVWAGSLAWDWTQGDGGAADGFKIHYGAASGNYTNTVDVGNVLTWPFPESWPAGTYYFAASAYNASGESTFSNEAVWIKSDFPQSIQPASGGNYQLTWIEDQPMAAALTGTPVTIAWGLTANPAAQNVTIPSDCTAVLMFFVYYSGSGSGYGLASATLAGNSYDVLTEKAGTADVVSAGVAIWYDPPTGVQSLDPAFDLLPSDISCIVAFVTGDNGSIRDSDAQSAIGAVSTFNLDTNSTDLVLLFDSQDGAAPATQSGWTSRQTYTAGNLDCRLSTADSPGASATSIDGQGTNYEGLVAVSIISAAAAATTTTKFGKPAAIMRGMSHHMWLESDWLKPTGGN